MVVSRFVMFLFSFEGLMIIVFFVEFIDLGLYLDGFVLMICFFSDTFRVFFYFLCFWKSG